MHVQIFREGFNRRRLGACSRSRAKSFDDVRVVEPPRAVTLRRPLAFPIELHDAAGGEFSVVGSHHEVREELRCQVCAPRPRSVAVAATACSLSMLESCFCSDQVASVRD